MIPTGATRDRFLQKIGAETSTGCRLWHGAQQSRGYGSFGWKHPDGRTRSYLVHRLAYEMFAGPIPEGMTLDHLCLNKLCVNVAHLEPVTRSENAFRGAMDRAYIQRDLRPTDLHRHTKVTELHDTMSAFMAHLVDCAERNVPPFRERSGS